MKKISSTVRGHSQGLLWVWGVVGSFERVTLFPPTVPAVENILSCKYFHLDVSSCPSPHVVSCPWLVGVGGRMFPAV